jgi:hypothetical protein
VSWSVVWVAVGYVSAYEHPRRCVVVDALQGLLLVVTLAAVTVAVGLTGQRWWFVLLPMG